MSIFKCKMCGGTIEFEPGTTVGVCEYCGTKQTLPKLDDDRRSNLYDRASHFRRNNDFDKASNLYEQILTEDYTDAEAYWSLVLCRYGIEYVEDPATHKRVPTVNRAQFTSVFDDDNYKSAIRYADLAQRQIYEEEAAAINEIQKGILAISQKEDPFDVFICYKEADDHGRRTPDSVLANELYHQLVQEGFKVFYARITLEDKLGTAYEPYIFAALNSAKVMVVLGTRPEYFNAVWVRNEWSRFLALVRTSGGKKVLIPAYRDMDPYDLPEEFSHLQALDMSRLGFMQDLIRGIKKIIGVTEQRPVYREAASSTVVQMNSVVDPLLRRTFLFLEDGEWERADNFCEQVLNQDPENAEAYIGKLMAELHVRTKEELSRQEQTFENNGNFKKAIRFGNEKTISFLNGAIDAIRERKEINRRTELYQEAVRAMQAADSESAYLAAEKKFQNLSGFRDSAEKAAECRKEAEYCRKDTVYKTARLLMESDDVRKLEQAVERFRSIGAHRDAERLSENCLKKIEDLRRKEEEARHAAEMAEQRRIAVLYDSAVRSKNTARTEQEFKAAAEQFRKISDYRDARELEAECYDLAEESRKNSIYDEALSRMAAGDKESLKKAVRGLQKISGWKDADEQLYACQSRLEKIHAAEEAARVEKEQQRLLKEQSDKARRAKLKKKLLVPGLAVGVLAIALVVILFLSPSKSRENNIFSYSSVNVGDTILFGRYEQDNDLSNGKEDIEWLVLDKQDDRMLVISKYALNSKSYHDRQQSFSWNECSLRAWLNEAFLESAFNADEQSALYADSRVEGRVFLLSKTEVDQYFESSEARQCLASAFAEAQGAYTSAKGYCWWWLRSKGENPVYAQFVNNVGTVNTYGSVLNYSNYAVRPALWIDLSVTISPNANESSVTAGTATTAENQNSTADNDAYQIKDLKDAQVGDFVLFGRYEQDNDLENGQENIEWLVLDKQDDKVLLISKYALDCQRYNNSYTPITWEECSLRTWLNGTFLNSAFSSQEQTLIANSIVSADKNPNYSSNPGKSTKDKVFLLSISEADKYFSSDSECQCKGTAYCYSQGAYIADNGNCWWWLRSPGNYNIDAARVNLGGSVLLRGYRVDGSEGAVRPALWIDLRSDTASQNENNSSVTAGTATTAENQNSTIYNGTHEIKDLKDAQVGDYVLFGKYEQDNDTSNGKEDIEWLVLDKQKNRILVISKYALDCQPYNTLRADVTWEKCSLRTWLNGTFLNNAFSSGEQNMIVNASVSADKNPDYSTAPGRSTKEKVFLLSIPEVNKYFSSDSAPACQGTAYCYAKGAYEASNGNCWWWLRSPGLYASRAAGVDDGGSVDRSGRDVYGGYAVRPALWIDTAS